MLTGAGGYFLSGQPAALLVLGGIWMAAELVRLLKNKTAASYGVLQFLGPISLLTMWVAPAASYVLADTGWYSGYRLWVPAETYFRLAAPGTAALLWGFRAAEWLPARHPARLPEAPRPFFWFLLAGGLSAQALLPFAEGYLRYPAYLCSMLLWPALMLGMQIWPRRRWQFVLGGAAWALLLAVQSTFFGMGMLWVLALWASPPGPLSSGEGEPTPYKDNSWKERMSPLSAGEGVGGEASVSSGEGEPTPYKDNSWKERMSPLSTGEGVGGEASVSSGEGEPTPYKNNSWKEGMSPLSAGEGVGGEASIWRDVAILGGLALLILFLISFKYDYREQKAAQPGARGLFFRMAADKLRHPASIVHPAVLSRALSRMNQGFHTAQAMAYVPSKAPFVYGETLVNDLWGALVPRFWDTDKPRAGGKENLRRFAGQTNYRISANIGVYGEAYVNFGTAGGWLVLLAYGGLLGGLWRLSDRWLGVHWGPYLFLPAVHVESDIGIVLNHISKSALVAVAIILLWHGLTYLRRRTHL